MCLNWIIYMYLKITSMTLETLNSVIKEMKNTNEVPQQSSLKLFPHHPLAGSLWNNYN